MTNLHNHHLRRNSYSRYWNSLRVPNLNTRRIVSTFPQGHYHDRISTCETSRIMYHHGLQQHQLVTWKLTCDLLFFCFICFPLLGRFELEPFPFDACWASFNTFLYGDPVSTSALVDLRLCFVALDALGIGIMSSNEISMDELLGCSSCAFWA